MSIEREESLEFDSSMDMSAFNVDLDSFQTADEEEESSDSGRTAQEEIDAAQKEEVASTEDNEEKSESETSEEDTEDNDDASGDGGDESSPDKLYSSLANTLMNQGILSSLDPEQNQIKNADDLLNAFNQELTSREFADLNDTQKAYLQGLRGGIPEEEVQEHLKVSDQLNSITSEEIQGNQKLREAIIKEQYMTINNMAEAKAAKLAKIAVDTGEDMEEAESAFQALKDKVSQDYNAKLEANKQKKIDAEKAQEKQIQELKETIDKTDSFLEGYQLTKTEKNKLYEQMTKPVGYTKDGTPLDAVKKTQMEDPQKFAMNLHFLYQVTNGFKDLSRFNKKVKSKASNELDAILKNQNFFGTSGKPGKEVNTTVSNDFKNLGEIV